MAEFETLSGGDRRIKANRCGFLFSRLEPGVFYTAIIGSDTGEVKHSPLDEISAEYLRFQKPLTWFIDAEKTTNVAAEVFQIWTAWFSRNHHMFDKIHVLAPNKAVHLTVSISQHISRTSVVMQIYKDRKPFDAAMARQTRRPLPKTDWLSAQPVHIIERQQQDGTMLISCETSAFSLRRLNGHVIFSTASGREDGSLGNIPFDLMQSLLASSVRRSSWFLDASRVTRVTANVMDSWVAWIQAHKDELQSVVLLTQPGRLPVGIELAKERRQAHPLIITCQSLQEFEERLERKLRGFGHPPQQLPDFSTAAR